jgi:hypothetical protein
MVGVGLEPGVAPQAGLEGDGVLAGWNARRFDEGLHGFETMRGITVPHLNI